MSFVVEDASLEYFKACARIRGISTRDLVARVVKTIVDDHMVLAILDDGSACRHVNGAHRRKKKQ